MNDPRTVEERTAGATERILIALRADGLEPSGIAESGNVEAAFTFVVNIGGHDYNVEVAAEVIA